MARNGGGLLYALLQMIIRCFIRRDAYRIANTREKIARAERRSRR